jgi:DNA-binding response OmpR family regulator
LSWLSSRDFAIQLRRRYGEAVPIVLMTADTQNRDDARRIGADAWVTKPCIQAQLLAAVQGLVGAAGS